MSQSGRFEAEIEALAFGGDGVTHSPEGLTVFVPHAAPGDRAALEFTETHKTYARARIETLQSPGPGRTKPPCPVAGICGGCQWQHLDYSTQLKSKENFVAETLKRIGGFTEPPLKPIVAAASPLAYRNKVTAQVSAGTIGFYKEGSHDLVPLPDSGCAIQTPGTDAALKFLSTRVNGIEGLRHVVVRGNAKGETLIALVSHRPLKIEVDSWLAGLPGLKGVVNNIQPKPGNTVFGPETRTMAGKSFIIEEIEGIQFRLSATSFFQVNSSQAATMTRLLLESRNWAKGGQVLELYCGVGTLSLPLAKAGADLLGVENWSLAVEDARLNAQLNSLTARFECADAVEGFRLRPNAAVLLLDPPRKGLSPQVLEAIQKAKPAEIVYVSCDPASLARDLKALATGGWKLESVQALDMFPQTYHVESITVLRRF